MAFDFDYFKKFNFSYVLKFATLDLLKQKKLIVETLVLFLLLIGISITVILTIISSIAAVYFFLAPELGIFTIIPLFFAIIFLVFTFLIGTYFSYRLISFALKSTGKKFQNFSIKLAIKMFLSGIVAFFVSLFSLYELKWLLFGVIGFILFFEGLFLIVLYSGNMLISAFAILSIIIACILLFIYYVMIVRNFIRVSFSGILLIEKNLSVKEAVKSSWILTSGKAALIFIVQLIFTGIVYLIQQIALAPLSFIDFSAIDSNISLIVVCVAVIVFAVLLLIIMVLSELIALFGQVAVYKQITLKKK